MSIADELQKLAGLRDAGVLSEAEFNQQKARALAAEPPETGAPESAHKRSSKAAAVFVAIVLFVVVVLAMLLESERSPEAKAKDRERAAIKLCWDEQKRKSLTLDEQRFIAGACELMERDFLDKYRHKP